MKERVLEVRSSSGCYPIRVGSGIIGTIGATVSGVSSGTSVALVTDSVVETLYADAAESALEEARLRVERLVIPSGERSKSWARAGEVLEAMSECGIARDDIVLALGGGVVGDLAGFCAAAYMRGIGLVQVPTTLLAQVDSAIGGKTAVDLPRGKNMAGAFWAPRAVVADTGLLRTLPEAEWRSGMAEVVKSAILYGEEAVAGLESDAVLLAAKDAAAVESAVLMAAGLKARVVSADERESGGRESLNYGHTLGHAMEQVAGYGAVAHGVAVAEGIRFAARLSEMVLGADAAWSRRQDALLGRFGLPAAGCPYAAESILSAMRSDKKVRSGVVRFILSTGPGAWESRAVDDGVLSALVHEWCAGSAGEPSASDMEA